VSLTLRFRLHCNRTFDSKSKRHSSWRCSLCLTAWRMSDEAKHGARHCGCQLARCHWPCAPPTLHPCATTLPEEKGKGVREKRKRRGKWVPDKRKGREGRSELQEEKKDRRVTELTGEETYKTKIHWIKILGTSKIIGDKPSKKRRAYFNTSLILSKGRRTLLMLVFVYHLSALGCAPICRHVSLY
jgi:hypothetical protein